RRGAELVVDQAEGLEGFEVARERTTALQGAALKEADHREAQEPRGDDQRRPAEPIDESSPACEQLLPSSYASCAAPVRADVYTAESDIAARVSIASSVSNSGSTRPWIMIPSTAAQTTPAIPLAGRASCSRSASTWRASSSMWTRSVVTNSRTPFPMTGSCRPMPMSWM